MIWKFTDFSEENNNLPIFKFSSGLCHGQKGRKSLKYKGEGSRDKGHIVCDVTPCSL
jgi:hypothetical protein